MWFAFLKPAIVITLLLLLPWGFHVVKKRWGASTRYYGLVLVSPVLGLGLLSMPATFLLNAPTVGFALMVTVCLLPPLLLGYSFQALAPPAHISYWVSIPGLLLSLLATLFIAVALLMSQASYIVG